MPKHPSHGRPACIPFRVLAKIQRHQTVASYATSDYCLSSYTRPAKDDAPSGRQIALVRLAEAMLLLHHGRQVATT
jgi:hypothetical protein